MTSLNSPSPSGTRQSTDNLLEQHGCHLEDGNTVCWNDDSKDHPRNWGPVAKCYTTIIICWVELYMTGISSAGVSVPLLCCLMCPTDWNRLPHLTLHEKSTI